MIKTLLTVTAMLLVSTGAALAQATGEVNGTITDKSSGAVAGAAVKLTNLGTKIVEQAQTNANGYFLFFKPSLHGQQNRSVLYYLDGIINTDFRGSIYGVLPIIDAMEEFKVQSHNEKTEYGGVLGGVVNLVSRSGTNEYHGSAWEFVRNN